MQKKTTVTNIGLFGGTFDPIHIGHLLVAETVRVRCNLDRILFIPAKTHALKDNSQITMAEDRLAMVKIACSDNPFFDVSDIEVRRSGTSYTIDTVKELRKEFPKKTHRLHFLVGSDIVNEFHRWKSPDALLKICNFIAFGREGMEINASSPYADIFKFITVPALEISATEIRNRVSKQLSIRYLVPDDVNTYIRLYQLYRNFT